MYHDECHPIRLLSDPSRRRGCETTAFFYFHTDHGTLELACVGRVCVCVYALCTVPTLSSSARNLLTAPGDGIIFLFFSYAVYTHKSILLTSPPVLFNFFIFNFFVFFYTGTRTIRRRAYYIGT